MRNEQNEKDEKIKPVKRVKSKETRAEKLARKKLRRDMEYRSTPEPLVLANLSVNHPHYGMSPAEHLRASK